MCGVPSRLKSSAVPAEPAHAQIVEELSVALAQLAAATSEERILMAGTANLARSTVDFPLSIGPILEALEEQVILLQLLSEMHQDAHGMSVSIGRENPYGSLAETSVVATGYGPGATAKVGILGPTRMDYPTTMAAVRAVARLLANHLSRRRADRGETGPRWRLRNHGDGRDRGRCHRSLRLACRRSGNARP